MPLLLEKRPISIIGMVGGTRVPIPIFNLYANRVVDKDTSRIVKLSTIGGELNTLQHFGHNSRALSINGTINLVGNYGQILNSELIITGVRTLKETKSAVLVMLNHGFLYGVIEEFTILDEAEGATIFKYDLEITEKDFRGVRMSANAQRILLGGVNFIFNSISRIPPNKNNNKYIRGDQIIPSILNRAE